MRGVLATLVTILLTLSGCHHDDDVLPPSPPATAAQSDNEPIEVTGPPLNRDSELFQHSKFGNMPYRILLPRNYDSTKAYPLHIFLHGIGERGFDNEKQLEAGASHFQTDSIRNTYPAFVIFLQCPETDFWFSDTVVKALKALIDNFVKHHPVNGERISIGGFSMGAYGTFAMVAANPGFFHAAVVISGDGDETKAAVMARSRWRIFAGEKDEVVPSSRTEKMATALREAGAAVSFTLYPYADHTATWVNAFSEPDFFHWLFSDKNLVNNFSKD